MVADTVPWGRESPNGAGRPKLAARVARVAAARRVVSRAEQPRQSLRHYSCACREGPQLHGIRVRPRVHTTLSDAQTAETEGEPKKRGQIIFSKILNETQHPKIWRFDDNAVRCMPNPRRSLIGDADSPYSYLCVSFGKHQRLWPSGEVRGTEGS